MQSIIEVKVKYYGDTRKWEDIPVNHVIYSSSVIDEIRNDVLNSVKNQDITVIRWNYIGSYQGYYLDNEQRKPII